MTRIIDRELGLRLSATEALLPAVSQDMGNPPWEAAQARILIVRLSPLRDIEGSTSHLVLFSECRRALPQAYIDFAFFPDAKAIDATSMVLNGLINTRILAICRDLEIAVRRVAWATSWLTAPSPCHAPPRAVTA